MKNLCTLMFGILLCSSALADTHGLKSLRCSEVLGSNYTVTVSASDVELVESWVKTTPNIEAISVVRHRFSLEECRFTPFSVDMQCRAESASFSVRVTKLGAESSAHKVSFEIEGISAMESRDFETYRLQMGKAARCFVNDLFEIL
jgi:hypothetical protein